MVLLMGHMVMSFNSAGDLSYIKEVSEKKLHTFEILLPYPLLAQAAAQDIFKKGSHDSYLTVNFLKSRFCLGNKVVLEVTTDDVKFFRKTLTLSDERPEVSWVKDALSQRHFEDVISITYHSYHSALYDDIDREKINIGCILKCAMKYGPDPTCIIPCITGCFTDKEDEL